MGRRDRLTCVVLAFHTTFKSFSLICKIFFWDVGTGTMNLLKKRKREKIACSLPLPHPKRIKFQAIQWGWIEDMEILEWTTLNSFSSVLDWGIPATQLFWNFPCSRNPCTDECLWQESSELVRYNASAKEGSGWWSGFAFCKLPTPWNHQSHYSPQEKSWKNNARLTSSHTFLTNKTSLHQLRRRQTLS